MGVILMVLEVIIVMLLGFYGKWAVYTKVIFGRFLKYLIAKR
jgi:hypothetical protein